MIDFVRFVGANDYSPLRFSGWLASALLMVPRFMSRFARNQTNSNKFHRMFFLNDSDFIWIISVRRTLGCSRSADAPFFFILCVRSRDGAREVCTE